MELKISCHLTEMPPGARSDLTLPDAIVSHMKTNEFYTRNDAVSEIRCKLNGQKKPSSCSIYCSEYSEFSEHLWNGTEDSHMTV